ncbi:MAG: hypothetical protein QMC67_09090 [Candidatus Wallbacteria bacterium]
MFAQETKTNKKRGMTTAVILVLLAIISVLFYSLIATLKESAHMAGRYSRISILANIADAAGVVGLNELDAQLADTNSKIFKAIYEIPVSDKPVPLGQVFKYKASDFKCLQEIADQYPGTKVDITIEIKYLRELSGQDSVAKINGEKIGLAEVTAKASNSVYGASQTVREKRNIKITCNAVPVLSRFTFFLRSANSGTNKVKINISGKSEDSSASFNLVEVQEDGKKFKGGKPVIINNKASDKIGWIFLGGGENPKVPILVNLAGGNTQYGEAHHLHPSIYVNEEVGKKGKGVNDDMTSPYDVSKDTVGFYESGFCSDLYAPPASESGLSGIINTICNPGTGPGASGAAYSSVFHFFDGADTHRNRENVMLGNVYRAYVALGVFQCQKQSSGGWKTVGFFPYNPNMTPQTTLPSPGNSPTDASGNPISNLSPVKFAQYLFDLNDKPGSGSDRDYTKAMSNVRIDWYYNSAIALSGIKPSQLNPDEKNSWGSMLPEELAKNTKSFVDYDKSLNDFCFETNYFMNEATSRQTIVINDSKSSDKFWEETKKTKKLNLNKVVIFNCDTTIPPIDDIERGGIIICKGTITVNNIKFKYKDFDSNIKSQKNQIASSLLTIISMGSDSEVPKIVVEGSPVCAHLIALGKKNNKIEGEIDIKNISNFELYGAMATNKITPKDFTIGGKIQYNPMLYPNPNEPDGISYLVNPNAYSINLMPEIAEWAVTIE